ncbi:hypothetical protein [Larkinella humicola]|uniref:Uncharacterized protein n=1 Tax=Larkinella humicola TaxID=2607654 RepID=A0A5N1JIH6_9BACT|nr:hypothetical protein [Larkinella humicola]KAA9354600.1 hypothetical protein F0P93_08310 [Larkinella humicola]
MVGKKGKYILFGLVALLVAYMVYDAGSEPGINDLKGTYREVAMYRNENNTGPIVRIYAVTVKDTLWEEMRQYGDFMLYTKYGTTKVYFFPESRPAPTQVFPKRPHFDKKYESSCLAVYEKDAMSQVNFRKMPFTQQTAEDKHELIVGAK